MTKRLATLMSMPYSSVPRMPCAGASGVRPPEHPSTARQRTPLALVVHARLVRGGAALLPWCWTCAAGRGMVGLSGATRGAGLGKGGVGKAGWKHGCSEFVETESALITTAFPSLLLLYRTFTFWLHDRQRINTDEAKELLDALTWLASEMDDGSSGPGWPPRSLTDRQKAARITATPFSSCILRFCVLRPALSSAIKAIWSNQRVVVCSRLVYGQYG